MENEWRYLDPDNNKPDPVIGLFCIRCKRKIKETQSFESFTPVEKHPENPWVRKSMNGKHLMGSECWKQLIEVEQLTTPQGSNP